MPYNPNYHYDENGQIDSRPHIFDIYEHTNEPDDIVERFVAGELFLIQLSETPISSITNDDTIIAAYNISKAYSIENFFSKFRKGRCVRLTNRRMKKFVDRLKLYVRLNFYPENYFKY